MSGRGSTGWRSKTLRSIFLAADAAGWRWRESGHVVLYPPDGSRPFVLSKTAYDGAAMASVVATARRSGLDV